ncbi:MAG TPA: HAD family hydrolase [Alphaproteobacteria bacterium]|nr:HAD family hydrolase [Alphaproteobacteria bacterium]
MRRRGLLLDRDGVINVDHGYVGTRAQFEFMPGIFGFLRAAQDRGYRLAILTNQSGVARGNYTARDHENLMAWMLKEMAKEGIAIDLTLACFEHIEGTVPEYRRESFWRKPNPGMVLDAVQKLRLDPARSAFLGDTMRDMEAAQAGGIKTCLWLESKITKAPTGVTLVRNFDEALKALS